MQGSNIYATPELLNAARHAQYRLKRTDDFGFARALLSAPLGITEVHRVAAQCPVVITDLGGGNLVWSVLMGLEEGRNACISEDGRWTGGPYVPAYLRRYPFVSIEIPENNQILGVGIDMACSSVSADDGEPLFDEDGKATELLDCERKFVEAFQLEVTASAACCKKLKEANLLMPRRAHAHLPGDRGERSVDGFLVVDEQRLCDLPDSTLVSWARDGTFAVVIAHLQSLSRWEHLLQGDPQNA